MTHNGDATKERDSKPRGLYNLSYDLRCLGLQPSQPPITTSDEALLEAIVDYSLVGATTSVVKEKLNELFLDLE